MGSLVSSVLGMDNGMKAGQQAAEAGERYAKDVYFRPYTMTSGFGTSSYSPDSYSSQLAPQFYGAQAAALGGASGLLGQLSSFDPVQRQQDLFRQQAALLQPEFQAQQTRLESGAFGKGRLGLRLAGAGVGAGGGMVQPDVFGLGQAQSQALGQLAVQSREQALQEGATLTDMATNLLAQGIGIAELEATLMKLGVDAESARATAAGLAGQVGTGGYQTLAQAGMAQDKALGGLFGGIAGGLLGGAGLGSAAAAGSNAAWTSGFMAGSDITLKDNIKLVGKLPSGLNWYTWTWKPEYFEWTKKTNRPVTLEQGVLAQEVQKIIPEAVKEDNGYLTVNYDMVMG